MTSRDDRYLPSITKAGEKDSVPQLISVQEEMRKLWEAIHSLSGRNGTSALLNSLSIQGNISATGAISTDSSISLDDYLEWNERAFDSNGSKAPSISSDGTARIYFDRVDDKLKVSEDGGAYQDLIQAFPPIPTLPSQRCRVFNSANISIADSSDVALTFNSERFDTDSMHSTAVDTERITFNTAGQYLVGATLRFAANATGNRIVRIRLNGTTYICEQVLPPVGGAQPARFTLNTIYDFIVTDYVEVVVFQTSGGALNVQNFGNSSPEFWAIRIQ